jgi:hypothetical protein
LRDATAGLCKRLRPVASVLQADFVEELVKGLLTEELVWPQFACVNISPPPFRPIEFRCEIPFPRS